MDRTPTHPWLRGVGTVAAVLILLPFCSSGDPEPSATNLELNDAVLQATPHPEGTAEVERSSRRQDVEGRYCIDITSAVLQPTDRDVADPDIVGHYEDHFADEGWAIHRGNTPVGSVASFDSEESSVTVATEDLASEGQYTMQVTHPC